MTSSRARALVVLLALVDGAALLLSCGGESAPPTAAPGVDTPTSPEAPAGAGGSGSTTPSVDTAPSPGESLDGDLPIAPNGDTDVDGSGRPGADDGPSSDDPEPAGQTPTVPVAPTELSPITIWIAGDSTVANGQTPCPRGWGGAFAPHFSDLVSVNNSAAGGRSVHTWLYEVQDVTDEATGECALNRAPSGEPLLQPRWQAMLDGMREGDYLFIQFGINDGDPSCDRHVGIDAFVTAYGMMALAAKERGAQPIFLTPVSAIACNGTTARGSRGEFVPATIDAGVAFDVPVIDLHARSVELFQARGFCPVAGGDVSATTTGAVGDFFCDDHTHFSASGAVEIGDLVAQALIEQQIPLAAYLR
jgi:lysophospholipase L1-like esterase